MMNITVEQPFTMAVFVAHFDPPREVQAGFAKEIRIDFYDYGIPIRDDDEQFSVSVRIRGKGKGQNGKIDRRTRDNGLLVCFDWSELKLALEVMQQIEHPMAAQTIHTIQERIERVCD